MTRDKTRRDAIAARRDRLSLLLISGVRSQRRLAAALQVSVATINRDIEVLRQEWRERHLSDVESAMSLDLERLDRLIQAHWQRAVGGDDRAAEFILRAILGRANIYGYGHMRPDTLPAQPLAIVEVFLSGQSGGDEVESTAIVVG